MSNLITTIAGLEIGNFIRRSQSNYWIPAYKGRILAASIDDLARIGHEQIDPLYEYVELDDDILKDFGFYVDKSQAHIIYNESGNIFKLNKLSQYIGVTDENSAQIESSITYGLIPEFRYEFTWGAAQIQYVHTLQNLFLILCKHPLVKKLNNPST